jgi:penicillin-binding protein 2
MGEPGGRLSVVHCDTRAERTTIAERQAVPAKDLTLTIDINLQIAVDAAVGDVQGSAVVLDPRTGEVLALVSHPSFDPNWFVLGFSDADWAYVNDPQKRPLLNRATQAGYPTGSIFKAITTAAAMHDLGYTGDTEIDCPSQFTIGSQTWNDWTVDEGVGPQGLLTLHWGLAQSCNTVFYQIGAALDQKDPELLPNMAKAFGLGAPTGIPYLQEVAGVVPDPAWKLETVGDYWATGDAVNLAIGQGYLLATPLQMAVAYAAIANGGSVLQPYIVAQTQVPGGTPEQVGEIKVRNKLPLNRAQIREIQSALRDQTSTEGIGSYRVFGDFAYPIAGKTGTAQNEENKSGKPHSWFASFGPYGETATVTTIAMVESVGEGVLFAAPITRHILEAYLNTDLPTE